jgi:DNA primase
MTPWVDFREIKESVSIEQVLATYGVQLKRVRRNYLRGRCPLPMHDSARSQQSFGVNTIKNVWACHSVSCCQARGGRVGGNILDLVCYLKGCSIREAALWLQGWCGSAKDSRVYDQLVSKGRETFNDREPLAPLPFSLNVCWHPYLQQRGVDSLTASRFGVGYYAGSGFLRHRVVFPIHDSDGRRIGYAGRSVDDSEPRYLFPAGFHKSQVIYNLHRAVKEVAAQTAGAIVVEGFFDCLRVHQSGYRSVVALMGSRLSEVQRNILLAHFRELTLMLDGDDAGRRASEQLAAQLWRKISLRIVEAPSGRQSDQLSSDEIRQVLCGARSAPERKTRWPVPIQLT